VADTGFRHSARDSSAPSTIRFFTTKAIVRGTDWGRVHFVRHRDEHDGAIRLRHKRRLFARANPFPVSLPLAAAVATAAPFSTN